MPDTGSLNHCASFCIQLYFAFRTIGQCEQPSLPLSGQTVLSVACFWLRTDPLKEAAQDKALTNRITEAVSAAIGADDQVLLMWGNSRHMLALVQLRNQPIRFKIK